MLFVPFPVIVSWPVPNYINPERRPKEILVASFLFLFLATAIVGLRVWTRVTIRRFVGADDFLVIFALACSAAVTALSTIGLLHYDWDRHEWNLPLTLVPGAIKLYYVARIFWVGATTAVRMSVILLYYRLLYACQASKRYYVVLHVFTAFTMCAFTAFLLVCIFPCSPVKGYWDWNMMDPKCIDDWVGTMAAAVVNTFSEFIIATLPLMAVFFLQVDQRQRWNVVALLSLGFFVAIIGCIRCVYIWKALISYDLTWWSGPGWVCANVEIDVALMCSCAAPLSPHIARLWRRMRGLPLKPQAQRSPKSLEIVVKNANYSANYEAVAEWAAIMSRTIDIEGIANDGFGYSVTITGPISASAKPRRRSSKLRKTASQQFQHSQAMRSRERKGSRWHMPSDALEPSSWGSTVFKKMDSGDRAISPSTTMTADNIEIALDAFSNPTVLNPTPHVPRDDADPERATVASNNHHLYSSYLDDESVEHLPLPTQTRQVQRHAGVLELIRYQRKPG